jgi:hypothetical protein
MALTRIGAALDYLSGGGVAETVNKRYSSENEVVNSSGDLIDVIYSGAETETTSTILGSSLGTLSASGGNITSRVRVEFSNEDAARASTTKLVMVF